MRAFANSNFNTVPDPIMPTFGQYNESSFQRLDLALVAAAQHGIRLILVLGNYWPFLGGTFNCCTVYLFALARSTEPLSSYSLEESCRRSLFNLCKLATSRNARMG
jgi:hypothetical protein